MNGKETFRFRKMQAIGNHFVVVDGRAESPRDWQALTPRLCAERAGIGADGLLVVVESPGHDAGMLMFNPDGTPDFCGNGLRCVARLVAEERDSDLVIETHAGPRACKVRFDADGVCSVAVDMGEPSFAPADVPVLVSDTVGFDLPVDGLNLTATALSTGTAHTMLFVDALPDDAEFFRLSPQIEHHPLFPERTSVMWTAVESGHRLRLRIWERGAGETWGCGTGACAAAVAAIHQGLAESPVTVASRGGALAIEWAPGGDILMTGPAEFVFEGEWLVG